MQKTAVDLLLDRCRTGSPEEQIAAVHDLLRIQAAEAAPAVIALLASPDAVVRFTAARALGSLGSRDPETAGAALLSVLTDPEDIVRSEAADTLGLLRYTPALDAVRTLLRADPEPLVRASAAETLGDLEEEQAIPDLERALGDPDEAVRAYAGNSLGLLSAPSRLSNLQAYFVAESSLLVKAELAGACYRLGASESLDLLLDMLDRADETPATNLLNLLVDLTERRRPPTLAADAPRLEKALRALVQRFPLLRSDAESVIAKMTGPA